jgi:hypothetical protein
MKTNFFSFIVATFVALLSLVFDNTVQAQGAGCHADCLFSDASSGSCGRGTRAVCSCSWGFAYAACEPVGSGGPQANKSANPATNFSQLPKLKNENKIQAFKDFLSTNCSSEFLNCYKQIFVAIKNNNLTAYNENLAKLEALKTTYPQDAQKITDYLESAK